MGWIYKIENIVNHKVYIGKTEDSISKRWNSHVHDWKVHDYIKHRPLYDAFTKYGIDNFTIEPIEEIVDSIALCEREKFWIKYYNSYVGFDNSNGYNATLGGDGAVYFPHTDEEVLNKYFELLSVKAVAEYYKCNSDTISIRLHKYGIDPTSLEWQRKLKGVPVARIDCDGNIQQIFPSRSEAAEWAIKHSNSNSTVGSIASNISRCCAGTRRSAAGFYWKNYTK